MIKSTVAALLLLFSPLTPAEMVVIAHPAIEAEPLSQSTARLLFLGKMRKLAGVKVRLMDQMAGSAQRDHFYRQVTGKNAAQLRSHWSRLIFTGRGKPPEVVGDAAAVKARVAITPGAVGYVDASLADSSVRVLYRLPSKF